MKRKIKIALIDDEIATRVVCRNYLAAQHNVEIVGEASNVADAKVLIEMAQPDLVLLDIHLGTHTGFDLLQHFPNPLFKIIFITAYEKYALTAIKAGALDYLLKPILQQDLVAAIEKAVAANTKGIEVGRNSLAQKAVERLALSANDGYHIVWVKDIMYCSASGNYTTFHLANGRQVLISKGLKEYEEILPAEVFLRIHQSYLVNMNYVQKFTKSQSLILQNGAEITVATRKKEEVTQWLKKFS